LLTVLDRRLATSCALVHEFTVGNAQAGMLQPADTITSGEMPLRRAMTALVASAPQWKVPE
jgi:hypothetical protein